MTDCARTVLGHDVAAPLENMRIVPLSGLWLLSLVLLLHVLPPFADQMIALRPIGPG